MSPSSNDTHFDAIIVGSGFGGSVMAYRLAEAGLRVCVLERGKAYPPGAFPRTPGTLNRNFWDPNKGYYGMFDVWSFKGMEGLVSSGLGGGSLIYANVLLRKDPNWFVSERDGKPVAWPVSYHDLERHYESVEKMMAVQMYPFDDAPYSGTQKTIAMREAAQKNGYNWMLVPLAVTFRNPGERPVPGEPIKEQHPNLHGRTRMTCRLCGECDIGCNYGSKNTLDYTYLSAAKRLGAKIETLCEVRTFAPAQRGYSVQFVRHHVDAGPVERKKLPLETLTCDQLILSGGTFGTTHLVLKNRTNFPGIGRSLGSCFSGNGDLLTVAFNCRTEKNGRRVSRTIDPSFGPVITSAIRMPDTLDNVGVEGRGFYIEDAGIPQFLGWVFESLQPLPAAKRALKFAMIAVRRMLNLPTDTNLSSEIGELLGPGTLSSCSLPLLGMGRDMPDGRLTLQGDRLQNDWRLENSYAYFKRMRNTMEKMADTWGATFADNPIWFLKRVITVHALGGCPMGTTPDEGVVDTFGEVHNHPGLFIADGSVLPGPVGANPSLTIGAVADRFADRVIERHKSGVRAGGSPKMADARLPQA
jgi:cholesterol oxidase